MTSTGLSDHLDQSTYLTVYIKIHSLSKYGRLNKLAPVLEREFWNNEKIDLSLVDSESLLWFVKSNNTKLFVFQNERRPNYMQSHVSVVFL